MLGVININKKSILLFLLPLLFLTFMPNSVYAKDYTPENAKLDTQVGKASKDKENAIAMGKSMIGKVRYYMANHNRTNLTMLTYDYANDKSSTGNYGIDCSEFVALMFNKGYGIQWGDDNAGAQNTWGLVNPQYTPKEYLLKINDWSEAKRGDIVLTNGYGHVVVALGDGLIIGSNGENITVPRTTDGPSIQPTSYHPLAMGTYNVVRLPDKASDAKGGILKKGHPSNDFNVSGKTEESKDSEETVEQSKFVGEDAWKNKMINFQNQVYKSTFKGIDTGSTGFINSAFISGLNTTATRILSFSYVVMMFITIGLFLFMFITTIIYLVILPNGLGGYKLMDMFEKTTGLSATVTRQNTLELIGRLGISTFIVACLYANVLPIMASGFIKIILMVLNIFS